MTLNGDLNEGNSNSPFWPIFSPFQAVNPLCHLRVQNSKEIQLYLGSVSSWMTTLIRHQKNNIARINARNPTFIFNLNEKWMMLANIPNAKPSNIDSLPLHPTALHEGKHSPKAGQVLVGLTT